MYVFHNRPEKKRIIHPPHPLYGQILEVLCHRREAEGTSWIARLENGSRISIPSSWTDHPVDKSPVPKIRAGSRATPRDLRHLADLLEVIVSGSPLFHNRSRNCFKGGHDERATSSLPVERAELGGESLESSRPEKTPRDTFTPDGDGKGSFKSEEDSWEGQGESS